MSGHISKARGKLTKSWYYFAKTSQIHLRSHIKSKGKVDQVLVLFCKYFSYSWIVIEEVAV
jgi:hypothetical protein